jgi:hypothetical protein
MPIQKITGGVIQDGAVSAIDIASVSNTAITGLIQSSQIGSANATLVTSGTLPTARLPAGSVVQVATYQFGSVSTGTGTIPLDDTIPQITEGTEFMTLAITPTSATSKLVIIIHLQLDKNNANALTVALFQDSTANAIASQFYGAFASGSSLPLSFIHTMTAGTTSSTTFRVRAGSEAAGTVTVNGRGGGRIDGGVSASSIVIYEVAI